MESSSTIILVSFQLREQMVTNMSVAIKSAPIKSPEEVQAIASAVAKLTKQDDELTTATQVKDFWTFVLDPTFLKEILISVIYGSQYSLSRCATQTQISCL